MKLTGDSCLSCKMLCTFSGKNAPSCKNYDPKPITNYDRLIRSSPEELADLIFFELAQFPDRNSILAYLKQEAEEQKGETE